MSILPFVPERLVKVWVFHLQRPDIIIWGCRARLQQRQLPVCTYHHVRSSLWCSERPNMTGNPPGSNIRSCAAAELSSVKTSDLLLLLLLLLLWIRGRTFRRSHELRNTLTIRRMQSVRLVISYLSLYSKQGPDSHRFNNIQLLLFPDVHLMSRIIKSIKCPKKKIKGHEK